MKIGDKVKILRKDIILLNGRKNRNGKITSIDGAYILVRPDGLKWEVECYENEIKLIK